MYQLTIWNFKKYTVYRRQFTVDSTIKANLHHICVRSTEDANKTVRAIILFKLFFVSIHGLVRLLDQFIQVLGTL
jgi:hypothetical protein